jgi:hypothetical protein
MDVSRRQAIASLLVLAACKSQRAEVLRPEDSVDPSFSGCQKSCGVGETTEPIVPQPSAKIGDFTRCPVSGALFRVTEATPRREHDGKSLYMCCTSCARYFDAHADAVLAARKI